MLDPKINSINSNQIDEISGKTDSDKGVWADAAEKEAYSKKILELRKSLGYDTGEVTSDSGLTFLDSINGNESGTYKGFEKVKNFMDHLGGEENFAQDLKDGVYSRGQVEGMMKEAGLTKTDLRNYKKVKTENKNLAKMFGLG